jgi:hypothetical protein
VYLAYWTIRIVATVYMKEDPWLTAITAGTAVIIVALPSHVVETISLA